MSNIKIIYKTKEYSYEKGTTLYDIASDFKTNYKKEIMVGSINNTLTGLLTPVTRDCIIDFYDITTPFGMKLYEKGILFLLSKSVKDVLNCDIKIMHCVDGGIYCEILTNNLISEVTVERIKIRMRELVDKKLPISKIMVSRLDAIEYYEKINQEDKSSSLKYISNSSVSLYKLDDSLDYYYGTLPYNTSVLDEFNLKYLKDNKVILLLPYLYDLSRPLKYEKNDMLINSIEDNDKYLEDLNISTSSDLNELISTGNYGDIIRLSESVQNNKLFSIADKISNDKDIKIVLITGPSSSGKTTTSRKLTLFLKSKGLNPIPISVDDYYVDIKDRVLDEKGQPEKEKINAIDTELFNKNLSELLDGKEVKLPKYNFVTGKKEISDKCIKLDDKGILIIEGIHAFNNKLTEMIPDKNKFKIFICPLTPLNIDNHNLFKETDNRLLRRIIRDNLTRGASAAKTLEVWTNVRKAEEENIFPFIKDADEIFNTSLVYELGVLKTYAEPLLFSVSKDDDNYDEAIRLINLFRVILGIPSENVPNDSILREFIGGSCFKE